MTPDTAWRLAAIVVPALTALLGAWGAARFAIGKYRQERAFDRRLAWHEALFREMEDAAGIIDGAISCELANQCALADGEWNKLNDKFDAIGRFARERELYASQSSFDAIGECLTALAEVVRQHVTSAPADPRRLRTAAGVQSQALLRKATVSLAEEVRKHLALETLDRGDDDRRLQALGRRPA